ncbi:hypothetical protein FRC04_000571 [Tulasnella sp. 424]|nr:hypothetical protein FRC04_000571 [Tulasnella sp. 424]KAG8967910.1 hypothetical protein FRC05_001875 [Tulasnella sp. 425]
MQESQEGIDRPIPRSVPLESQEKEVEPNVGFQPSPELREKLDTLKGWRVDSKTLGFFADNRKSQGSTASVSIARLQSVQQNEEKTPEAQSADQAEDITAESTVS